MTINEKQWHNWHCPIIILQPKFSSLMMKYTANIQSCIKLSYAEIVRVDFTQYTSIQITAYQNSNSWHLNLYTWKKIDADKSGVCKMFCPYKKIPPFYVTLFTFGILRFFSSARKWTKSSQVTLSFLPSWNFQRSYAETTPFIRLRWKKKQNKPKGANIPSG